MKMIIVLLIMMLTPMGYTMEQISPETPPSQEGYSDDMSGELLKEVAPGVYAGQTKVGNEIVYFGMEKVDDANVSQWDRYASYSRQLTENSRGILQVWSLLSSRGIRPPFNEAIQHRTGFSDEAEYTRFMDKLDAAVHSNKNTVDALKGVPTGIAGFFIEANGNYYVVYASKKPVTGRFPFPAELPEWIPLKKYYEYFGDILMIVRSEVEPGDNAYRNRGIFKNPISFIEDGNKYPGLSMKLHGFSAAVVHHFSKDKHYMRVAPAPAMRALIVKVPGWQRGDLIINDKDILDFSPEELDDYKSLEAFGQEPSFRIKIDALIRLYKGE